MIEKRELIWLDPQGGAEHVCIGIEDGKDIRVNVVQTLDQIPPALGTSDAIIVRLIDDCALLRDMQLLMQECGVIVPVITRVERGRIDLAVHAMRQGAAHVVAADERRPAVWAEALTSTSRPASRPQTFIFADPVSQKLLMLARRVAETDVTALLTGPTGSGKEVLAKILHEGSKRRTGPFVPLNCAAMPESMIEDLLFGHEKGAFTGALREHAGVFEQAHGGTLFLDEIGELPIGLQAKLLRVLQEKQLTRLGARSSTDVDVRLVAATNRDLKAAIEAREFREDLYFRLSTFKLQLPALRERPADIVPLAHLMLEKFGGARGPWAITPPAEQMLIRHRWPGNVRELGNVMQRAIVLCAGSVVDVDHLVFDDWQCATGLAEAPVIQAAEEHGTELVSPANDLGSAVRASEHRAIMAAIQGSNSRAEAAKTLGISPRTLRYKLAQLKGHGLSLAATERG